MNDSIRNLAAAGRRIRFSFDSEVIDYLSALQDKETEVKVRFTDDPNNYSAKVTALNAKHRVMVIEGVSPVVPDRNLKRGLGVSLQTENGGRTVVCQSSFIECFLPCISNGLILRIPAGIATNAPRSSFRVLLDAMHRARITFALQDRQQVHGVVSNISQTGVGLLAHDAILPSRINEHDVMDCRIDLPGEKEISGQLEVRNIRQDADEQNSTFLGARLLHLSHRDRQILTNFIRDMQRKFMLSFI